MGNKYHVRSFSSLTGHHRARRRHREGVEPGGTANREGREALASGVDTIAWSRGGWRGLLRPDKRVYGTNTGGGVPVTKEFLNRNP
jgi:hypothetical protein